MLVKFPHYIQQYTDSLEEYEVSAPTLGSGILQLFNRFPQLMAEMLTHPEQGYILILDDDLIYKLEDINLEIAKDSVLYIESLEIEGSDGDDGFFRFIDPLGNRVFSGQQAFGMQGYGWTMPGAKDLMGQGRADEWAGIAMQTVGYTAMLVGLVTGQIWFSAIGSMLVTMGGWSIASAYPGIAAPNLLNGTLNNSATYTFAGVQNTTASGTPFHIVYGTHRVGGQVLNMYTEGTDPVTLNGVSEEQTILYAQIGLGEGEIEGVSDVHINKFAASYYNAVETAPSEAYVRLGKETQEPMPAFTQVRNTTTINSRVMNLQALPTTRSPIFSAPKFIYGYVDNAVTLNIGTYKWVAPAPLPDGYDPTNGWVAQG